MTPKGALKPSKALNGVYGVHLLPHSPFTIQEIKQHGRCNHSAGGTSPFGSNQWLIMQKVWQQRPPCLKPIQCSLSGDRNLVETVANVLTSLPFIALGIQAPRKNLNCKIYANSLIGVGVASSLYHASRGRLRKYLRWADYTMIATSTVVSEIFKFPNCYGFHCLQKYAMTFGAMLGSISFYAALFSSVAAEFRNYVDGKETCPKLRGRDNFKLLFG